ncbi:MAG: NlpC/P60 family protein [Cyanobacteriota bacterium]
MARLSRLEPGTPAAPELLQPGTTWRLQAAVNGYERPSGHSLATQAGPGRHLRLLPPPSWPITPPGSGRRWVQLLEDGYRCWLHAGDLLGIAVAAPEPRPRMFNATLIRAHQPAVLAWALAARRIPNRYLWGGCLGPDFDCSGLIQAAFAASGIWIPRDAYQQERFCQPLAVRPGDHRLLVPGDLIFFGTPQRCTHVGLHLEDGHYLHSSGAAHGRDGLGIDNLSPRNSDPVSTHYRNQLRGAGRLLRSHDGSTLP